jgi:outer membrane protein assembly factor BamB
VGVAAEDGGVLWTNSDWVIKLATVPSPLIVDENRIFLSGGYNSGCMMLRLINEGDSIRSEEVFRLDASQFGADQHTPILYQDHIYGVRPGGELTCLDLEGNLLWTSGGAKRFGLGPFLLVDGLLLVLDDQEGILHLIEATPTGYNEMAQAKLLNNHDAWGPMAMVKDRLILRDATMMVCVRLPE